MMPFLNVFRRIGGKFEIDDDGIRFWHPGGTLNSIAIETDVPGFMTDWQQPLVVALTQTTGLSIVHETVYENRLGFTDALVEAGAHIQTFRECLGGSPCRFGQTSTSTRPSSPADPAAGCRDHRAGPARRVQVRHRRPGGRGPLHGARDRPHPPRVRALLRSSTTSGPSTSSLTSSALSPIPVRAAQQAQRQWMSGRARSVIHTRVAAAPLSSRLDAHPLPPPAGGAAQLLCAAPGGRPTSTPSSSRAEPRPSSAMRWMVACTP